MKIGVVAELLVCGLVFIGMIVLLSGLDQIRQSVRDSGLVADTSLTPEDVELLAKTDDSSFRSTDALIIFLGISSLELDLSMLIWLQKNSTRLPLVAAGRGERRMEGVLRTNPKKDVNDSDARRQVAVPAIGLILVGLFDLLPIAAGILAIPMVILVKVPREVVPPQDSVVIPHAGMISAPAAVSHVSTLVIASQQLSIFSTLLLGLGAISLFAAPLAVLMIFGGTKMRKLQLYPLATIASIVAMLPFHTGCLIGFPIGIWSLVVLLRPDVRAAFQNAKAQI